MPRDPIVERTRPRVLDDIVGQDRAVRRLKDLAESPEDASHLLLSGPPGCGKTSAILAWARLVYGTDYATRGSGNSRPVRFLNMSALRNVRDVLERIHDTCHYIHDSSGSSSSRGLVVCDEADSLNAESQEVMVYCLRKYSSRWIFVLIMNQPSKIGKRLWEECEHIPFLPLRDVRPMIEQAVREAKLARYVTQKGIRSLIQAYGGDLRRILNAAQGVRYSGNGFIPEWKRWGDCDFRKKTPSGIYNALHRMCNEDGTYQEKKTYLELAVALHRPGSLRPLIAAIESDPVVF